MRQFDLTMAHSDTEDVFDPAESGIKQANVVDNLLENEAYEKNIHSGHFMVSHVHEATESDQGRHILDIANSEHSTESRDSFANGEEVCEYSNKIMSIDSNLTTLFKCMSVVSNR